LAASGIFGMRALALRDDADAQCAGGTCSAAARQKNDAATSAAFVANVGLAAGVVGIGVGSFLLARSSENERRAWGIVGVGAGAASLGVGALFGLRALSKREDSDARCGGGACTPAGAAVLDEARAAAWTSNVALGVGLLAAGAGAYLLATGGRTATTASSPCTGGACNRSATPRPAPGGVGSLLSGVW
jgi:hypothetical protein